MEETIASPQTPVESEPTSPLPQSEPAKSPILSPAPKQLPGLNKSILMVAVAGVIAVVVVAGMYFWQQQNVQSLKAELDRQLEQVQSEKRELQSRIDDMQMQMEDAQTEASEAAAARSDIEEKTCKGTWKDGVCVMATCVDSDVNEKPNDIYMKGTVTYTDENGVATTATDECTGSKVQVQENWCYESPEGSGNYVPGKMIYDCDNGCFDGACIRLTQ